MGNPKLTVVFADMWRTYGAIVHEQQFLPYRKRSATIELTDEQAKAIKKRKVGVSGKDTVYEVYFDCWLEENDDG